MAYTADLKSAARKGLLVQVQSEGLFFFTKSRLFVADPMRKQVPLLSYYSSSKECLSDIKHGLLRTLS